MIPNTMEIEQYVYKISSEIIHDMKGDLEVLLSINDYHNSNFMNPKAASWHIDARSVSPILTKPGLLVLDGDIFASGALVLASNEVGDLLILSLLYSGLELR